MKKLNKKKVALLTACVVSAVANMGFAAEADEYDEYSGADYVVTATKTQIEKKDVPVAVEVITEQKIKDLGAYSVQDALRLAANVDVQDNGMTGNQVQLRGNSTMHTLILVDGKRMAAENTQSSQNAYELKRINISDVERIEVIRGNGSALYGSDAMGGVINIITKKATTPSISVNMHTGTKDEATSFMYSSGKQGKVSLKIGGGIEKIRKIDSGVYKSYSSNGSSTDASTTNMYGTRRFLNTGLNYAFDDNHSLDFDMNFMREQLKSFSWSSLGTDYTNAGSMATFLAQQATPGALKGMLTTPVADGGMGLIEGTPAYTAMYNRMYDAFYQQILAKMQAKYGDMAMPEQYPMISSHFYDNNRSDFSLGYNGKDGKHDYNFRTYFSELRKENTSWYKNLNTNATKFVDFDQNNYKQLVVEGKDSYKMDDNNTLTFGAEYKKDTMNGTHLQGRGTGIHDVTVNGKSKTSSEVSSETAALYLQDELKVGDKLLLIPAVRIDHHDSFGTHTSPKLGATYKLSENARLKANWGKGYRAPTLYELYAQMEKVGMAPMPVNVIGNPNLQPEESTNFDFGFEAEKGKTTGKVTYFHNKIKNMIDGGDYDPVKLAQNIIWTEYVNRGEVELSGLESEIGYNFDEHWSVRGVYNYLDAKDLTTGERLAYRARHNGLVQLTYTDAKENPLTVNLYNRYYFNYHQSNTEGYQNDYSYSTTGLIVSKQFNKNYRVYAGVDNIFNKSFLYDTYHTYSIDGRTWRVGAEMTF